MTKQWNGYLWGQDIAIRDFSCVSFQGDASTIIPLLSSCQDER